MSEPKLVHIAGSESPTDERARHISEVDPDRVIRFNIIVRRRDEAIPSPEEIGALPPSQRRHLSRQEFAAKYGAAPEDVARVEEYASKHGLKVIKADLAQRIVTVSGSYRSIKAAFGVELVLREREGLRYCAVAQGVAVPEDIGEVVRHVYGLDDRPMVAPQVAYLRLDQLGHVGLTAMGRAQDFAGRLEARRDRESRAMSTALRLSAETRTSAKSDWLDAYQKYVSSLATAARTRAPADLWTAYLDYIQLITVASVAWLKPLSDPTTSALSSLLNPYINFCRTVFNAYLDYLGLHTPPQLAECYRFPQQFDGGGQCIGILEFGGGYDPLTLLTYFSFLGVPWPRVVWVGVAGGVNAPGQSFLMDTEVHLDIEMAGALAGGARIAVYFAPVSELGFVEAFGAAIHDAVNKPSVLSVSWAMAESIWSAATMEALNQYFREAAAMGVTICVASGDHGSTGSFLGELPARRANVDFPGSNPYVLSCGGTRLTSSGGSIQDEVVWDEMGTSGTGSGGGVSAVYPRPAYQANVNIPPSANPGAIQGRGVPDVAGNADPRTGYVFLVDRVATVAAGTSSVAPLWAALIARINQGLNAQVGFLNVLLYQSVANRNALHDITVGSNGLYGATPGWDACTGFGSPDGARLWQALAQPQP